MLQWLRYLSTNKEWKVEILRSTLLPLLEVSLLLEEVNCKRSVTDMLKISFGDSLEPELRCDAFSLVNQLRFFSYS